MLEKFGNSFFTWLELSKPSLMVVVPHEDDEINTAGSMIHAFCKAGCEVTVVFMTNGDFFAREKENKRITGRTRILEAVQSCKVLGVPAENVIFLGYGDNFSSLEADLYTTGKGKVIVSPAGKSETYASEADGILDFRMKKSGHHSQYRYESLIADLKDVILSRKADVLISVDFDSHHDHRLNSIAFESAMGDILKSVGNDYHPLVMKSFAYSTAFEAPADFYGLNLKDTSKPVEAENTERVYETENPSYRWNDRLRFPVMSDCATRLLKGNNQYEALLQHKSQLADNHAERIINADKVYFLRRTDSLTYQARFEASSGDVSWLNDFLYWLPESILERRIHRKTASWKPEIDDNEREFTCRFKTPSDVSCVRITFDSSEDQGNAHASLYFSNGFKQDLELKLQWGLPQYVYFDRQEDISWIKLKINDDKDKDYGISEFEVYKDDIPACIPVVKVLLDDTFAYEYLVDESYRQIHISTYHSPGISEPVVKVLPSEEAAECHMESGILYLNKGFHQAVIRCESGADTYDQVVIRRISAIEIKKIHDEQIAEQRQRCLLNIRRQPKVMAFKAAKAGLKKMGLFSIAKKGYHLLRK